MTYPRAKRIADLLIAGLALVVLAPLLLAVALALRVTQGRPVFFRQPRMGKDGVPFLMLKFRTMTVGSSVPTDAHPVRKDHADPRITPLGRLLRRAALDELPQFWNVLRGEMSLVGPRPLPVDDLAHPAWLEIANADERARRADWARLRQSVPPGLTGLWQISPDPETDFENWLVRDLDYLRRRSLAFDLYILLVTPVAILRGRRKPGA
ncbi:MAG: UDP-glucose:undecaprenyl-phosphate glucose-1-phosphate transferase [bacterium ADurb.Bin429]|nr:MAG: UDP-glucose:undecaprenyl-phosphate glucose-1-phosphate transferase [bacterium ADurb.Bin429]